MPKTDSENIPIGKAEYCVFDFETTGTSAKSSRAIEIGIVRVKNGNIVDTYQSFINPGMRIPPYITQLTGISNDDVYDAPFFEEIIEDIINFFGDSILVAHNMPFDYSFLKNEFQLAEQELISNPTVCTLKLARKLYPELKSKSLGNLVRHFKIRHRNVHRGLGDATVTAKLMLRMFKDLKEDHNVESIDDLFRMQSAVQAKRNFLVIKKKLSDDLMGIPENPGVYLFKDAKGNVIYIGKAKSLIKRVKNYFSNTAPKKSKKIVRKASRLEHYKTNSELTALLTETDLIKQFDPQFNKQLKKYPSQYFIKVDLSHDFPGIAVSTKFDFDGNDYFGPYNNRETANTLIEIIDRTFQLRECTDKEFCKKRKCYLADIERCVAPCIESNIKKSYKDELDKTYDFLSGQNQFALDRLLNRMKQFSEKQKYEEAAQLRDTVNSILNSLNKLSILAEPINKANVMIEINKQSPKDYILLLEGKVIIRNHLVDEKDYFDDALQSYFDGAINLYRECNERDLEHIKIALSWLIKNRNSVKIYYLKNYESKSELTLNLETPKRNYIKTKSK